MGRSEIGRYLWRTALFMKPTDNLEKVEVLLAYS